MDRRLLIAVLFLILALLVLALSSLAAGADSAELNSHLLPLPMSGEFAHTHFA